MTDAAPLPTPHLETGLQLGGLLLRAGAYAVLASFASRFDFGQALLLGLLVGAVAASVLTMAWRLTTERTAVIGEVVVLALVLLWVRSELSWPDDPAQRAILGLAALGVLAGRVGGSALTRFGPSDDGFA